MGMAVEEASETDKSNLQTKKNRRYSRTVNGIAEEIADMEIMLEQLKIMFYLSEGVTNGRITKLARLSQMIEEAENSANKLKSH